MYLGNILAVLTIDDLLGHAAEERELCGPLAQHLCRLDLVSDLLYDLPGLIWWRDSD